MSLLSLIFPLLFLVHAGAVPWAVASVIAATVAYMTIVEAAELALSSYEVHDSGCLCFDRSVVQRTDWQPKRMNIESLNMPVESEIADLLDRRMMLLLGISATVAT